MYLSRYLIKRNLCITLFSVAAFVAQIALLNSSPFPTLPEFSGIKAALMSLGSKPSDAFAGELCLLIVTSGAGDPRVTGGQKVAASQQTAVYGLAKATASEKLFTGKPGGVF
jgi:hypothetical protein